MQWHRSDLNEGMILAFRRAECPDEAIDVSLHGLDARATYELSTGHRAKGAELM